MVKKEQKETELEEKKDKKMIILKKKNINKTERR